MSIKTVKWTDKEYPTQVCNDCAISNGGHDLKWAVGMWMGKCDVCGEETSLCAPRDYRYPDFKITVGVENIESIVNHAVYVAGAMSGLTGFNYPAFYAAEERLMEAGHVVYNPARTDEGSTDKPREYYLREAVKMLLNCDTIALIPGWEDSRGACLELAIAQELGMRVICAETHKELSTNTLLSTESEMPNKALRKGAESYKEQLSKTKMLPKIIGLCGFAGSGKDTFFKALNKANSKCRRIAFADALKEELADAIGITLDSLEKNKSSYRGLLQEWGMMRRNQNPSYWISKIEDDYGYSIDNTDSDNTIVITDVRFKNEIEWIKSKGGVMVQVHRDGIGPANGHISEREWVGLSEYRIQNNGSIEELESRAKQFLEEIAR